MLPFAELLERLPVPTLRRGPDGARAARRDHLPHDSPSAARAAGDRGDLLSMLLLAQDEEDDGGRHDRSAGARRGDDDLPRRPRDDRERADVDLVSAERRAGGRGARSTHEIDRVLRRPPADDGATFPRCRTSSASSPNRCGCIRRRGSSAAARSTTIRWTATSLPPRSILVDEPVHRRTATRASTPSPIGSIRIAGRRSSSAALPQFAYFPFGGGPRRCIGESFAWMELILVVATIAQQLALRASCPDIRSCRSRSSRCARSTA